MPKISEEKVLKSLSEIKNNTAAVEDSVGIKALKEGKKG